MNVYTIKVSALTLEPLTLRHYFTIYDYNTWCDSYCCKSSTVYGKHLKECRYTSITAVIYFVSLSLSF